jgi:hypothetical protein
LNGFDLAVTMKMFADAYPTAYQTLYQAKPITCSLTGTMFDAVPAPCAVILDVKSSNALRPTVILTAHDSPFLFLLSVLFPFSTACY